jgi:ABC-type dipeptide/oligopeptide/nickel transport system permease component
MSLSLAVSVRSASWPPSGRAVGSIGSSRASRSAALSSPVFLTGIFGILIFAYTLGWLPAFGSGGAFPANLPYFILPSAALALNMVALSLRMTRSGMIEALGSDYVRTAVVKGLPPAVVVLRHAFRNALVPLATVAGLQFGFLLTGTVLVDTTFGIAASGVSS